MKTRTSTPLVQDSPAPVKDNIEATSSLKSHSMPNGHDSSQSNRGDNSRNIDIHDCDHVSVNCPGTGGTPGVIINAYSNGAPDDIAGTLRFARLIVKHLRHTFGTRVVPPEGAPTIDPDILELAERLVQAAREAGLMPEKEAAAP